MTELTSGGTDDSATEAVKELVTGCWLATCALGEEPAVAGAVVAFQVSAEAKLMTKPRGLSRFRPMTEEHSSETTWMTAGQEWPLK